MRVLDRVRGSMLEPAWRAATRSALPSETRSLERTQFWSRERIEALQWQRLRSLVSHAYGHSTFYRKLYESQGFVPGDLKTWRDFEKLPVVTKADIRDAGTSILSREVNRTRLVPMKTGGSTGTPLTVFITDECSSLRNAAARRSDKWTGWRVGESVAAIWGNPPTKRTLKEAIRDSVLRPTVYLDTMAVDAASVARFIDRCRRAKPTLIFGHAHSIFLLAEFVRELNLEGLHPRGIIATSMTLLAHERELIENVFGVKVNDRYGCEEVGLIACECEMHEGLHVNAEHVIVEILERGQKRGSLSPGGEVVVTDLLSRAMPFIRYKLDDFASREERGCPCGRGLPLMARVQGRLADFLIRRDGTRVAGISLIENTLTKVPGIDQMQLVQEKPALLSVRVVPGAKYNADTEDFLQAYFEKEFPGAHISIERWKGIPQESNGKFRFSICRCATETEGNCG